MRASWIGPMTGINPHPHFTYGETEASKKLSNLLQVKQLKTQWSQRNECFLPLSLIYSSNSNI